MPPRISTWCRTKAASASNLVDIVDSSLKHIVCAKNNVNECQKIQLSQWMPTTKQHDHVSKLLGVQQVILGKQDIRESLPLEGGCGKQTCHKPNVQLLITAFKNDICWYTYTQPSSTRDNTRNHTEVLQGKAPPWRETFPNKSSLAPISWCIPHVLCPCDGTAHVASPSRAMFVSISAPWHGHASCHCRREWPKPFLGSD